MNKTFYATSTASQYGGKGYYEIHAVDEQHARDIIFWHVRDSWSFLYTDLEEIHPDDRILICKLAGKVITREQTRIALLDSIEHWKRLSDGSLESAYSNSGALCNLIRNSFGNVDCATCIIQQITQRNGCVATPYYDYITFRRENSTLLNNQQDKDGNIMQTLKKLAKKELDFLIGILEEFDNGI